MRKVILKMKAQHKYELIKALVEKNGNKQHAALKIGCTLRTVNRLIKKYKTEGKAGFLHGNSGRKPSHALSEITKADVITLYNNKYWDANFTHACELLQKHDDIRISPTTLRSLLLREFILSPKAKRCTKKRVKNQLQQLCKNATLKKEKEQLELSLVSLEDSHPRRPRCSYLGEMLQMDASVHPWFGNTKTNLHIAIDDASGLITGAFFDTQETLKGYYNVLHQVLNDYGIPAMFYTDNRTVFEYKNKKMKDVGKDTYTQFSYACHQLGIEIRTTSIPQAKGRVERAFETLQSRLPVELRLAGIKTLSEANVFLNSYIKEYNAKFSLPLHHIKSVFETQPDSETIDQTLAVLTERKIDNGHCIKFDKKYYKLIDQHGLQVHYHKGTVGMVIKTFRNRLFFSTQNKVYALDKVPVHEQSSKVFDILPVKEKPKKRRIPGMKHPWNNRAFWEHHDNRLPTAALIV